MEPRTIGLTLVWSGAVLLVAVLLLRIRRGAFGEAAMEEGPPVGAWALRFSILGAVLALAGTALMVWSLV